MNKQLLVPIKSYRQLEALLPYLEDMARPGMKIIFLVQLGANRFAQLAGLLLEIQNGLPGTLYSDTVEQQSHLTHRIEHASESLSDRGIRIEVKFYSGRLRPILSGYIEDDHHHTVVMRPRGSQPRRWLTSVFSALRTGNSSRPIPVLLYHPRSTSRR